MTEIDPLSAASWSTVLGEARLSAFAVGFAPGAAPVDVLVDGSAASFLFSPAGNDPDLLSSLNPLNWAWSAGLRHALVVSKSAGVVARRWDRPREDRRFRLPRDAREMEDVLMALTAAPRPRGREVVPALVAAFRSLRAGMHPYGAENLHVVRAFNELLVLLEAEDGEERLRRIRSLGELPAHGVAAGAASRFEKFSNVACDDAAARLLDASPAGLLNCHLLLRHAAGQLYQEAHFELERQASVERTLWGTLAASRGKAGRQQRDARFTPTPLARSLAEQGLDGLLGRDPLRILDPACGSGVFLQEALQVLESRGYRGRVEAVGFDTSAVSVEIARFCVGRAVRNAEAAGITAACRFERLDALAADADWGTPDVILMNPPFVSYRDLPTEEREAAKSILGELAKGQFDKAMPFLSRAVRSLGPGGVLASILPATLLDSAHGADWRDDLTATAPLRVVGRFKGFGYFTGAMVEPAFVVLEKQPAKAPSTPAPLTVVLAEEGAGDAALRALRRSKPGEVVEGDGYQMSRTVEREAGGARGWAPLSIGGEKVLERLTTLPTVGRAFDVRQGVRTGWNPAFLVSKRDLEYFAAGGGGPRYFRPAAGAKSISGGRLEARQYVFYPYSRDGLALDSEEEVEARLPRFYAERLLPNKSRLSERRGKAEHWWSLSESRPWQHELEPKLVTTYFGDAGSFAVDAAGDYVVVQGHAWSAAGVTLPAVADGEEVGEEVDVDFFDTDLPFAYTALLNSGPFSFLLSCFCPRVSGGQFDLSKRFVENVPLPDLGALPVSGKVVSELAVIGHTLTGGEAIDLERLDRLAAQAYGVPPDQWKLAGGDVQTAG